MTARHELGNLLKQARQDNRFTLEETAKALQYGSRAVISNFESGARVLPPEKIVPYSKLFGIDLNELVRLRVKVEAEFIYERVFSKGVQ